MKHSVYLSEPEPVRRLRIAAVVDGTRGLRAGGSEMGNAVRRLTLAGLWVAASVLEATAQAVVAGEPCDGSYAYVVKDATGRTVQRGRTGPDGSLGEGFALGADQNYSFECFDPVSGRAGSTSFHTGPNGSLFQLPSVQVGTDISPDSDQDGLSDFGEGVFGFNPKLADSDGDGISDLIAAQSPPGPGNGPLNFTGIIRSVGVGRLEDGSAFNDTLVAAGRSEGVFVFNVFDPLQPRLIAQVDTPGDAWAVQCLNGRALVADGPGGFALIDFSDPPNAHVAQQVPLGGFASAVTQVGDAAVVGLRNPRQLVVLDPNSGQIWQRVNLPGEVFDVASSGGQAFALAGDQLFTFDLDGSLLEPVSTFPLSPLGPDPYSGRRRLFVADGRVFATCGRGFDVVDVRHPANPILLGAARTDGPGSFKELVPAGLDLGLGVFGLNPRNDGSHNVSPFDLGDPANTGDILTTYPTPGDAFGAVIYNGTGFVMDGAAGLQVLRFLTPDVLGVPPAITLRPGFPGNQIESGQGFWLHASVQDDVLTRNVEFFLDGNRIATDGNYPFELFTHAPLLAPNRPTFVLQARATDTGGNRTWSMPITVNLTPDTTAPAIINVLPGNLDVVGSPDRVTFWLSEPVNPNSFGPDTFQLHTTGPDGQLETFDDVPVPGGAFDYAPGSLAATIRFPQPLLPETYRAALGPGLSDLGGNRIVTPKRWNFFVIAGTDRDQDGLPDAVEIQLGSDPNNPFSQNDGVKDGLRDFDRDNLPNSGELLFGLDPRNAHTVNPNILDGNLDPDGDALPHWREFQAGTLPNVPDSDGDRWNDETELTAGSDPLNPVSRPRLFGVGLPSVSAGLPHLPAGLAFGQFVGRPSVSAGLPHLPVGTAPGQFVGRPSVSAGLPQLAPGQSFIVGRPAFSVGIQGLTLDALSAAPFVGRPAVSVGVAGAGNDQTFKAPVVGRPAVTTQFEPQ